MTLIFTWENIKKRFCEIYGEEQWDFLFTNDANLNYIDNYFYVQVESFVETLLSDENSNFYQSIKELLELELHTQIQLIFYSGELNLSSNNPNLVDFNENNPNMENLTYEDTNLDPSFTFNNYFYSYDNKNTIEACKKSIDDILNSNSKPLFNPFFIYGESGIGKTHIISALGNELWNINPNLKILYKQSTVFTNEYTNLFKGGLTDTNKLDEFKELYMNLDVLILDDIQMLQDKEGTLKEFFSIFESMLAKGKTIIITSDIHPKNLRITDRILTRMLSGLAIEVKNPDSDTKTQIFKYKIENMNLQVDEDAINVFVRSARNVRELEGYLNKILLHSISNEFDDNLITESYAVKIINDITGEIHNLTTDNIIEIVASYYELTPKKILSNSRQKEIVYARNFAIYFLRNKLNLTQKEIAIIFNKKDHTAINKALMKFDINDPNNISNYNNLTQKINNKNI